MGGDLSKDISNIVTKILAKVTISATNNCQIKVNSRNDITIDDSSNIIFEGNNFSDVFVVQQNCMNTSNTKNNITNNISNAVKQIATTIDRAFEIPKGSKKSETVSNIVTNIATEISESFTNNCSQIFNTSNTVTLNGDNSIVFAYNNFSTTLDSVTECMIKSVDVNSFTNKLKNQISQTATTKVKSILGALIWIIIVIIIIGGGVFLEGGKALTSWKLWATVGGITIGYLVLAHFAELWPFNKKKDSKHDFVPLSGSNH